MDVGLSSDGCSGRSFDEVDRLIEMAKVVV
jgi:hypothetical protein